MKYARPLDVSVDGDEHRYWVTATDVSSALEQIGLGFKPFYRVHERDDAFAVLGIHTSAVGFVSELPNILAGKPMRRDKVIDQLARHVVFESDEELEYIIDGDTYVQAGALTLEVGPKLRFLRLNVV